MNVGGPYANSRYGRTVGQPRKISVMHHGARRPDLQGMRAVAVLAVFSNHLFDWPSGGFVGVDVFFVLSGFFITGLLVREQATNQHLSFQDFYVRRVKRILPSAVLVIVTTVVGAYVLFPAIRAKETLLDALYAAVFAANVRFEFVGADYFQQGQPPSPLQHYWSLSIEEQFYFVWPAALVLLFALTRRIRHGGKASAPQLALFIAMAVVVLSSFGWALLLSVSDPNAAYFSTFTRIWELGVGALVAIAGPWLARLPSAIRPGLAYVGLGGVLGSIFVINPTLQFPAPWAALPAVSTALMVASFHGAEVRNMFLLTNPVARYLGDTSYTLYLWHWPVITLLFSIISKWALFYALAIGITLVLTALTYHFYENPIRKSNWLIDVSASGANGMRMPSPSKWAALGGLSVVVILVSIIAIGYADRLAATQADVANALAPGRTGPCFGAPAMLNGSCVMRNTDVPLTPSVDEFANDTPGLEGSNCYRTKGEDLKSCDYGYMGPNAIRIALVGDSHAASLLPALWPILERNRWKLSIFLGTDCYLADPALAECEGPMNAAKDKLLADPYDLVLVTNWAGWQVPPERYLRAWQPIVAAGSRLAVVADNPQTSEEALACVTRVSLGRDRTAECGVSRASAFPRADSLVAAAHMFPGVTVIDLSSYYCTADRCPSVIGNVIVYRDFKAGNSHSTATFASTLAPAVEKGVRGALASTAHG